MKLKVASAEIRRIQDNDLPVRLVYMLCSVHVAHATHANQAEQLPLPNVLHSLHHSLSQAPGKRRQAVFVEKADFPQSLPFFYKYTACDYMYALKGRTALHGGSSILEQTLVQQKSNLPMNLFYLGEFRFNGHTSSETRRISITKSILACYS